MRMNRRNVLVGLGTIVAGGGAALGTGAFSSVEAERNVDITTQGDSAALVGLNIDNDILEGDAGETIEFSLQDDLNIDATTTFKDAFIITNNAADEGDVGSINITISAEGGNAAFTDDASSETDPGMYFEGATDEDGESITLESASPDNSETYHVVFDLEDVTSKSDGDNKIPDSITFTATNVS